MAKVSRVRVYNPGRKKARKRTNVGELVTISIPNRGRKTVVRAKAKRKNAGRRRSGTGTKTRRRSTTRRVVYRYRTKARRGLRGVRRGKRRNTGMLAGKAGQVFGVIGGATVTGLAVNTLVPVQFRTGFAGYIATAAVAMFQGTIIGKISKNSTLGTNMAIGGFVYLALKIVGDMLPGVAGTLPIGLRGMGIISPAQRGNPVIPTAFATNNMMVPIGPTYQRAMAAIPASNGMGRAARTGRMR